MNNFIVPQRGDNTVGLIKYLFGPGRFNEHTDQRVIACSATFGIPDSTRLDYQTQEEEILSLGRRMDSHRKAMGITMPDGHVWHCAISLPPQESSEDRKLTDEQWAQVARAAVEQLGFEPSGKAPCRWAVVGHGLSVNGNDHVHLVVNLVREVGGRRRGRCGGRLTRGQPAFHRAEPGRRRDPTRSQHSRDPAAQPRTTPGQRYGAMSTRPGVSRHAY